MLADAPADDHALLDRLQAGDEGAFTVLVGRYHGPLVRLALVFVSSRAVAEEVVQETWLAVLQGLGRFERRSSFRTWLYRILTNRAKTRGVRESRTVPFSALGEADEPGVPAGEFQSDGHWLEPPRPWQATSPEAIALRAEAMGFLERSLADLPAKQRAVVTLRDVEGLSSDEVCNVLELSDVHQRVLLHRGRTALRRALDQHLGGIEP